ncbi:hypothetical protein VNO77_38972 [Canavalia gladiata]|uniref:Uncharacterized protein n=1 Tax=Canavalia gladiata TaxID=3824 RepID=A0AAN9PXU0_CANGL
MLGVRGSRFDPTISFEYCWAQAKRIKSNVPRRDHIWLYRGTEFWEFCMAKGVHEVIQIWWSHQISKAF